MGGTPVTGSIPAPLTTSARLQGLTTWDSDWSGLRVVVTGIGVSGFAAADTLIELGARVVVVDAATSARALAQADTLRIVGAADVLLGEEAVETDSKDRRAEAGPRGHVAGLAPGPGPARRRGAGAHPGVGRRRTRLAAPRTPRAARRPTG